jgi:quercetin dioxygenase-like cupin family protein
MGGALAIIKVDRRNGGSSGLVMGYEEIPPGQAVQAHRHPAMDEIIFVRTGTGAAELSDRTATVGAGATIYIPQATRVMLRTGTDSLAIAYFFPQP